MKSKQKSAESTTATKKRYEGFTAAEKAAMQDRVQEMKVDRRRGSGADKADAESEVLAKIAELPATDRDKAKRLHAVIKANAPILSPNAALKLREKWPVDIAADCATAGTSSGRSNSRSIRSFALRSLTRSRISMETAFNGTQAAVSYGDDKSDQK